jgi:transposase-like protein
LEQVMSCESNSSKVQQWTDRLDRYRQSDRTVSEFCRKEGISTPSFYQWKKKLASEPDNGGQARSIADRASQQVQSTQRQGDSTSTGSGFQSVELLPTSSSVTTIRLPNGIEIEVGSDLRVIDLLVKQLLDRSTDREAGW